MTRNDCWFQNPERHDLETHLEDPHSLHLLGAYLLQTLLKCPEKRYSAPHFDLKCWA